MSESTSSSYDERRRYPRVRVSLKVECGDTPACTGEGEVTSLSVGGCFVRTSLTLAKGKTIFIRLLLAPESESVIEGLLLGHVRYHLPKVGLGVEFKQLRAGYRKHIEDIVEFHLNEAGEE
jgi:hypothetical protein